MIIKLKQNETVEEIEILIEYPAMTPQVERIKSAIESVETTIKCFAENNKQIKISITEIYYMESVDKKVFIYTKNQIYRSEIPLYIHAEKLKNEQFVQINKSCLLNLKVLYSVKSIFNSRMEATLLNQEKLHISRKYLPDIKQKLEEW